MLGALTLLLVLQLAGEVLVQAFALPLPGPVVGLVLLFGLLAWRGGAGARLRDTCNGLLQHLSLLFVPAGAGVMVHVARLGEEWPAILAALAGSTVVSILVTLLTLKALLRRRGDAHE